MNRTATVNPQLNTLQMVALVIGVIGAALLGLGAFLNFEQFLESYLFGFLVALSVPLGCLGLLLLQHLTGGGWGIAVRRLLEAGAITLLFMALLFVPIGLAVAGVFGEGVLYHWTDAALWTAGSPEFDPIVAHKLPYLNSQAFLIRSAAYFVIWIGLAFLLRSWSLEQDRTGNPGLAIRMRMLSGVGVALLVLTVSFSAFDWGMSLDPHWFSTIYGVIFMINDGLFTLGFLILMMRLLIDREPMAGVVATKQVHDLGKLLLGFTVLWAYVSFSQYVIIWSGNVAEFTPWYIRRTSGGWEWFTVALILFQFFVPFFLLLSRRRKRNLSMLVSVAVWLIVMRFVDLSWVILPEFHETVLAVSWMDFAAPLGMLGLWVALFLGVLKRQPLLPENAPGIDDMRAAHAVHAGGHH